MKFYYDYVCEPNHFRIIAESAKKSSKGINLNYFIGEKLSLVLTHELKTHQPTENDINAHVARCCTFIKATSEKYIQDRINEDYIMGALNYHRNLKKVYNKLGRVIWIRKD